MPLRHLPRARLAPTRAAHVLASALASVAAAAFVTFAHPAAARGTRPAADAPDRDTATATATAPDRDHATGTTPTRGERVHRKQVGTASVYAHRFAGRKMADGTRLDPNDHVAASKTLPLGTQARVTNLRTGQSTHVTIQDRGPYAKGRILDLSPAAAADIGVTPKAGVAKVEVAPISVPPSKAHPTRD